MKFKAAAFYLQKSFAIQQWLQQCMSRMNATLCTLSLMWTKPLQKRGQNLQRALQSYRTIMLKPHAFVLFSVSQQPETTKCYGYQPHVFVTQIKYLVLAGHCLSLSTLTSSWLLTFLWNNENCSPSNTASHSNYTTVETPEPCCFIRFSQQMNISASGKFCHRVMLHFL